MEYQITTHLSRPTTPSDSSPGTPHPGPPRETIAFVVRTCNNNGPLLRRCLESIAWADEVIVVDMFSADGTDAVCAALPNCRVFRRHGTLSANFNYGAAQAGSDWLFRLDSDEIVTPELHEELLAMLARRDADYNTYMVWNRVYRFGRLMRFGGCQRELTCRRTLFRRGTVRFPDRSDHEEPECAEPCGRLDAPYEHHNYRGAREFLRKMEYYTTNDARRRPPGPVPSRPRSLLRSAHRFWVFAIRLQAWRDGWPGLLDAALRAVYCWVEDGKARRRARGSDRRGNGPRRGGATGISHHSFHV